MPSASRREAAPGPRSRRRSPRRARARAGRARARRGTRRRFADRAPVVRTPVEWTRRLKWTLSAGFLEPVPGGDAHEVALVEQLDPHLGVQQLQLPKLAVLAGDERLLHDRHLEVEILLGQIEVGREGFDHAAVLVLLDDE